MSEHGAVLQAGLEENEAMAKHTPGPWEWFGTRCGNFHIGTPDRGHLVVMDFVRLSTQCAQPRFARWEGENRGRFGGVMVKASDMLVADHPDARLIAAAPDLLAALKGIMDAPDSIGCMKAAQEAIAKAEGVK